MSKVSAASGSDFGYRAIVRLVRGCASFDLIRPFIALFAVSMLFFLVDTVLNGERAKFGQIENFRNVTAQTATVAIAALGMTAIIIGGGIDLSVGTAIALSATIMAWCLKEDIALRLATGDNVAGIKQKIKTVEDDVRRADQKLTDSDVPRVRLADLTKRLEHIELASSRWTKWTPTLAVIFALGTGCLCGLLNGLLISYLKMVPFVVTLGTTQLYLGWAKWVADNTTVRPDRATQVPEWWNDILSNRPSALVLGLPIGVWVTLVFAFALAAVLHFTVFGRYIFAIGSNESTARLCGIDVRRNKIAIYTLGGLFVGIAGLFQFSRMTVGNPTSGVGLELRVIASVVIGGGSLSGGRASVLGTLTGALIMSVIVSGCTQLGASNPVQDMILGVVIVVAVAVDQLRHKSQSR